MGYDIQCRTCKSITWARNIVDLVKAHTNQEGRFVCASCRNTDTFIYRESRLQEEGETWKRWVKGVITIVSDVETYTSYIFLTADAEDSPPTGLHFHYYKDTRSKPNGRLKHGHGPGGPPVLQNEDLFTIIRQLVSMNVIAAEQ
ncbi:hypothetical protein FJY63_11670, partial [Candidatus Sumerlaeota bacterium]|nr:hypothetical protein [Candidatus Sumerlaeota bacterium]